MDHMKGTLRSEWEVTDLGEPRKIIGIEVTRTDDDNGLTRSNSYAKLLGSVQFIANSSYAVNKLAACI
jgi:hypothetical protein